jgi:tetratricopeptide (TPR) repeat protein
VSASSFDDFRVLRDRARAAASRGDLDGAIDSLLAAAGQAHIAEHDHASVLRLLDDAFTKRGDARAALTVRAYLASCRAAAFARTEELLPSVPPVDRAPVLAAQGRMAEAAREAEGAGRSAAAAIYRETAGDWAGARALWSRLALVADADRYVTALVHFNLARCTRQCADAEQTRSAISASVRLLEEAADHFESSGQRERAFDCFQVLVQIGGQEGAFEDAVEGFVNSIRILREDHLKHDSVLELFEEAIAAATESGEIRAAATLARGAVEFARERGLDAVAAGYALRQAHLWRTMAIQQRDRAASPEVVEAALLAAILAFGEIDQYAQVGELYRALCASDLDPSRHAHYVRAAARYDRVEDVPLPPAVHLRRPRKRAAHHDEVWHCDLLEWERRGSAAEPCFDVLLDVRQDMLIRRRALTARLSALCAEERPGENAATGLSARIRLAEHLGQLGLYAVLSPLESLFASGERHVKIAVLQALETLCYKRSFSTVRAALRDPDSAIVDRAAKTIEALCFPHAVDPISQVLREWPQLAVRTSALRALARIDTTESAEIVLGVLEHGAEPDRAAALVAIRETRGPTFLALARAALPAASTSLRASLRNLL